MSVAWQVLGTRLVRRDEGQVDVGLLAGRELVLGALRRLLEPLQRHRVVAQVDAVRVLEGPDQELADALVEVLAAEIGVAVGAAHLEDAVGDLEDRDVEGAAAEVEDRDRACCSRRSSP